VPHWLTVWPDAPGPWCFTTIAMALYAGAVLKLRSHPRPWALRRSACFAAGCLSVLVSLSSPLAAADELFPIHVAQHLLLGMLAPLLFALSAPVTLALRTLAPAHRRGLVSLLHSRPSRLLTYAPVAGLLYTASLWVVYLTPLFAASLRHPLLHELLHLHFLITGCLLTWPLVGLDPVPARGSTQVRIAVLLLALASHAALAKLIYAGWLGGGLGRTLPLTAIHSGAEIMYYGGDLIELALALVFFSRWYARTGRKPAWTAEATRP